MLKIGWSESGCAVIAGLVDCPKSKLSAAELLVRAPNTSKIDVRKLGIEGGTLVVRLVCTGTIDKRVSFVPPHYKVDLVIKVDDFFNEWQRAFDQGFFPPMPATWYAGSCRTASCTCP